MPTDKNLYRAWIMRDGGIWPLGVRNNPHTFSEPSRPVQRNALVGIAGEKQTTRDSDCSFSLRRARSRARLRRGEHEEREIDQTQSAMSTVRYGRITANRFPSH